MMLEMKPCPECEALRNVALVKREENVTFKGRNITFTAQSFRCSECEEEFDTAETMDWNLESARETYDRQHKTPTRKELIALRNNYGASQKAFSLLLGFGELTINSYEQGNTPDSTHRLLLRLAASPEIFRAIYSENKHKIGAIQRGRIEASDGFSIDAVAGNDSMEWRQITRLSIVDVSSSSSAQEAGAVPAAYKTPDVRRNAPVKEVPLRAAI